MVALRVEEVKAVFSLTDVDGVAVRVVFEDQLFEVEESAFVGDLLADLHARAPGICGVGFRAVGALVVGHDILDLEALLENCAFERLHLFSLRAILSTMGKKKGLFPEEERKLTSCCTVILTFTLFECGSVQMKLASMILTLVSPLSRLRHSASSSLLSSAAETQWLGGCSHRSQPRQK